MNLESLAASGGGRMGAEKDWGEDFFSLLLIEVRVTFAVSPTTPAIMELYWAVSRDGTDWPGAVTGSDASYTDDQDLKAQLIHVMNFSVNNSTSQQIQYEVIPNPGRWGLPVLINQANQELSSTANTSKIIVAPMTPEIQ
jgi:hypothetical protein